MEAVGSQRWMEAVGLCTQNLTSQMEPVGLWRRMKVVGLWHWLEAMSLWGRMEVVALQR